MNKDQFLRLQYLRMINSDDFVVEIWRSSCERFLSDMWDRTPSLPGARFLNPIDPTLGFSPANVEWQFPKVRKRRAPKVPKPSKPARKNPPRQVVTPLTKEERRARELALKALRRSRELAAKEARRRALVQEFFRWEQVLQERRG